MADRWMDERDREWRERDWRRAEALGRGEAERGPSRQLRGYEERSWADAADDDDERYDHLRRRRAAWGGDAPDYDARSRVVRGGPQTYRSAGDDDVRSYRGDRDREARRAWREGREPEADYDDYFERSRGGGVGHSHRDSGRREAAERSERPGEFLHRAGERIGAWFRRGDSDPSAEDEGRYEAFRQGSGAHRGRGPKGYQRSDQRISEDAHDRLTDDPWLDATDIELTVAAGEVTLSGQVDNREAKHRAERLVEDLSGVRHVQNNLRVDPKAGFSGAGRGFGSSALEAEMRRNELGASPAADAAGDAKKPR